MILVLQKAQAKLSEKIIKTEQTIQQLPNNEQFNQTLEKLASLQDVSKMQESRLSQMEQGQRSSSSGLSGIVWIKVHLGMRVLFVCVLTGCSFKRFVIINFTPVALSDWNSACLTLSQALQHTLYRNLSHFYCFLRCTIICTVRSHRCDLGWGLNGWILNSLFP